MSRRRLSGALVAIAVAVLGLAVTPAMVTPAHAVTGSPPVTAPDSAVVYQGNVAAVSPLRNDTDPDGDRLAVCRMGEDLPRGLRADAFEGEVGILAGRSAEPGTYTITYYACDFSYLTQGTIAVEVKPLPKPKVRKIADRPGRLKVQNPADFSIQFLYGDPRAEEPDGVVRIAKHSSVVIRVHRNRIIWIAINPRLGLLVGHGRVKGIDVGRVAGRHVGHVTLGPRLAKVWRGA